ncbi:hypothetical protein L208DRAFT_1133355, partial [Tricholoma matsutake]
LLNTLTAFQKHKPYFIQTGVCDDLHIPKFYSLLHFIKSIKLFGTIDNYNTETFEHFHIDFAKKGWRASNHQNNFPQIVNWLSHQEMILSFDNHI